MKEDLQRIEFRKAIPEDVDLLVRTRIEVLRAANGLTESADIDNTRLEPDQVADIVISKFQLIANEKDEKEYRFGI